MHEKGGGEVYDIDYIKSLILIVYSNQRKKAMNQIRFSTFPKTVKSKDFSLKVVNVFKSKVTEISTINLDKVLNSDSVLSIIRQDL